jgi:preprotein translocase subunit SecE
MNTERKAKTTEKAVKATAKPVPRKEKKSILKRMMTYFVSVKNELKRVSWPTRKAIINSTLTVLVFVLVWSIYIGLWDYLFAWVMQSLLVR